MSTIMEGINESIKTFVLSKLPAEYAEAPDLAAAKSEQEDHLSQEQKKLLAAWKNANKVSRVYQFISADAPSLMKSEPPIHMVLADKSSQLATSLAKLEAEEVKGLGQTLIDSAATASLLEKGFVGIESILKSLDGDLKKGDESDEAYKLVTKMLAELDEAAAADDAAASAKTLVDQLKDINAAQLGTDLGKIKKKIGTFYDSLVKMTLAYQEVHPPLLGLTSRQVALDAAITALAEDLSTKTTATVGLAAADLAALNANKEKIRLLGLADASRVPAGPEAVTAEETASTPEEVITAATAENTAEVKAPAGSALEQLDGKLAEARKALDKNAALKISYGQTITDLQEALAAKQAHNAKIEVHLTALGGTKEAVAALKTQIQTLEGNIGTLVKDLKDMAGVVKKGSTGLADAFKSEMANLDAVYGALAGLNSAISQADFNSDIKEYFGKAVARLDGLAEGATKLMGNMLLIEYAVGDLTGWAGDLKKTVTDLQTSLKDSALSFRKAAGKSTGKEGDLPPGINDVIKELEDQLLKDEELIAPKGAFPAEDWARQFPGKATTLTEWQAFFEAALDVLAEDDKVQEQTIAFLTQLRPEPAAA